MDGYDHLTRMYEIHPVGAPKNPLFDEILRILFTPEEANITRAMNFTLKREDRIAFDAGLDIKDARRYLENMARKLILFSKGKDDGRYYSLLPLLPGIYEFPFMKGGGTPVHNKLAKLWDRYYELGLGQSFGGSSTPLARVISVERTIPLNIDIHPYEKVSWVIEEADFLSVGKCSCRVIHKKCGHSLDTCLIFGDFGRFLTQRGVSREITREEAFDILDRSEGEGLVHTTNNVRKNISYICNCCTCCCLVLQGISRLKNPNAVARSGYVAKVDQNVCTGCKTCMDERCNFEAISMEENRAVVDHERCIGCGLCVSGCPEHAVALVRRKDFREPPLTGIELVREVAKEKGLLETLSELYIR
jgi:Na+-translocating ferredoxin:NAD+ oxidoreductase subunit B